MIYINRIKRKICEDIGSNVTLGELLLWVGTYVFMFLVVSVFACGFGLVVVGVLISLYHIDFSGWTGVGLSTVFAYVEFGILYVIWKILNITVIRCEKMN